MEKLGYGPDKRLPITVSTRDVSYYRDPAVILIDQLKQIYMDGELQPVDTTNWYPKVMRKDYTVGMNITESEVDDPDVLYYENYACGAARNYTGYCNPQVDELINQQSIETDLAKRKQLVWRIERKLIEDDARPVIFFPRGAVCRTPSVKGLTRWSTASTTVSASKTSGSIIGSAEQEGRGDGAGPSKARGIRGGIDRHCPRLMGRRRKSPVAFCACTSSTRRRAYRCTRRSMRTRLGRQWAYSITSSCSTSTQNKTACSRSSPIWPPPGLERGGTQLTFHCARASSGTTASRSPPRMSNAPGTC